MLSPPRADCARDPFVGRRREIGELEEALDGASQGRGRLFVVFGEAGIGKTRLAREIASRAEARSMEIGWGLCWEVGTAPAYWPWTQALRPLVGALSPGALVGKLGTGAHRVAQILPELAAAIPGSPDGAAEFDSADARFYLFEAVAGLLAEVSADRPLLLIVDDAHRADLPSLLLLRFLAHELPKLAITIVVSARESEVRNRSEIAALFGEIARDGTTLALGGIGMEDTAVLLEASLATSPPPAMVRSLHDRTGGSPYYLGEFARLIRAEVGSANRIQWERFRLPGDVRAALARRLEPLGAECREVLSIAAVAGREFALAPLREVSGLGEAPLHALLAEAERADVLASSPREGRRRFSHALVREALYEELSPGRRARLHRELGESLARRSGADRAAHTAEVAHHFFEAARGGNVDGKAIEYERLAASQAVARLAYEEGETHYRRALELLDLRPGDEILRCELLLALGEAASKAGGPSRGRGAFMQAAAVARSIPSPEHLARAAVGVGVPWLDALTVDSERVALLEEVLTALGGIPSALRVRVLSRLALALYWERSSASRRDALSREAVEIARALEDPATLAYALEARRYTLWDPDHVEERLAASSEMVCVADRLRNPEVALQAHSWRLLDLLEIGDIAGVDVEIATRTRLADALHQPLHRSLATVSRAMRAFLDGRLAAAERLAEEACVLGRGVQPDGAEIRFVSQMVALRREQGRAAEIEVRLRDLIKRYPSLVSFRCALAAVYADLARPTEARVELDLLAARNFADLPRDVTWYSNLAYLTDACVFLGDAPRAQLLYELMLPYAARNLVVGAGLAAFGSGSRLLGLLALTISRIEDAVRHFEDALEMNQRIGARPWLAYAQREAAEALCTRARPGDRERAQDLLRRALATARELGMKRLEESAAVAIRRSRAGRTVEIRQEDDSWVIGYEGSVSRLRDRQGLRFLAHLIANPAVEFPPRDLAAAVQGAATEPGTSDASGRERDRVRITKTIRAAIEKIAATNPRLGTHLRRAIQTGNVFRYAADPPPATPYSP